MPDPDPKPNPHLHCDGHLIIRLPKDLLKEFGKVAARNSFSKSALIRMWMVTYLSGNRE